MTINIWIIAGFFWMAILLLGSDVTDAKADIRNLQEQIKDLQEKIRALKKF